VVRFVPRLCEYLHGARVVAVGQKTAMALTNADVVVDAVGTSGGLQALELLATRADEEAWYIGAEEPSSALDAGLKHAQLERWAVYRNQTPHDSADQLKSSDFDCVTFASGSAVRAFVGALGVPTVPVVVLGRSTRVVAENLGVSVASMASKPTMTALANAISEVG
jgi:uroporphyrinogen-III synthase